MEIEVVNYIKEARSHGLPDLEIKQNLLKAGWEAGAVEESFAYVKADDNRKTQGGQAFSPVMTGDIKPVQPQAAAPAVSPSVNVATTNQPAMLSDTTLMQQKKGGKWWKILLTIVIIGLLGGGGAYAYYTYVVNNPTNIWNKFLSTAKSTVYQSDVSFSYSDPNSLDATDTFLSLKDIKFSFAGNVYADITDLKNPQSQTKVQYTYASGNTSFSTGFEYILKDKVLYVNIGDNPIFSSLFGAADNGQKVTWLKFDLNQIANSSSTPDGADAARLQNIFNQDFQNQIQKIWDNAQIIKVSSFEGKEQVNNVQTLHFKNELDKQALKTAANQTVQKFVDGLRQAGATIKNSDIDNVNFAVNAIVDKINVQDMETWVGQSDYRLYKVHFVSNAPSIISTINYFTKNPPSISIAQNRDAKRMADIHQLAAALELYYNDYNGYPAANSNGQPDGGITPTYIGLVPTAPTPADGTCTNFYNAYWYTPTGKKHVVKGKTVYDSYTLTFCLGSDTSSYKAGIGQLSPQGIKDNIPCPSTDQTQCTAPAANNSNSINGIQDIITKAISAIQFNATVNIDATYHDYGTTKTLTPPSDAYDILGQAREKSRDAKRIADIRQLASALELYFNDKNAYPSSLQQLAPTYIGLVPTAPTPADGNCTDAQNTYNYTQEKNNSSYTLTFCLGPGASNSGYSEGVHTLTPAGIDGTSNTYFSPTLPNQ